MLKKKVKVGILSAIITIGVIVVIGSSSASLSSKDKINNSFKNGSVDISISEKNWEDIKDGKFNIAYDKVASIENKSKSDSLIRVAIIPRWVDEKGNPWVGDTSKISIEYDKSGKWIKDNSAEYYYYSTILPTGSFTEPLIKSVTVNVDDNLKDRYKGKKLIVDVKAEAIIANKEAYREAWVDIQDENIKNTLDNLCK